MSEMTKNSDLIEMGIDEFASVPKKEAKSETKKAKKEPKDAE